MEYIPYIWIIVGIVLLLSEFIFPGFVVFFFGIGALVMGFLTWLIPSLPIALQIVIWSIFSGLTLVALRRYFKNIYVGKEIKGSTQDSFIGRRAVVIEAITDKSEGRVKFQGTTYKATTFDHQMLKVGETVEIIQKDNMTLIVTNNTLDE